MGWKNKSVHCPTIQWQQKQITSSIRRSRIDVEGLPEDIIHTTWESHNSSRKYDNEVGDQSYFEWLLMTLYVELMKRGMWSLARRKCIVIEREWIEWAHSRRKETPKKIVVRRQDYTIPLVVGIWMVTAISFPLRIPFPAHGRTGRDG